MNGALQYQFVKPARLLEDFVYGYSSLCNLSDFKEGIIIPNGRIDLLFCITADDQYHVTLMGLETKPKQIPQQNIASFFAISFNPLAVEYIFHHSIAALLNTGKIVQDDFWNFSKNDLQDFDAFCEKASKTITALIPNNIDERKRKLFSLIFATNGEIGIKELSEKIFWSERQINRYFKQQLGLSLKSYCNILRFQASLAHIKEGKLYPQLNFADQSHFIKEIKKLSGVSPKELFKNENDRFLQFLMFAAK